MPVSPRLVTADATSQTTYSSHSELNMVSVLTYFHKLVSAWSAGVSVTLAQAEIDALDASFESVGDNDRCLLLRPGIGDNDRVTGGGTYEDFYDLTVAEGVEWVVGHFDPSGNEVDFPHPLDPTMRDLVDRVYEFLATYLTATSSTTVNGVTFNKCPCTTNSIWGSTAHGRKEHVMATVITKPTDVGTEMSIGFGTNGAVSMPIWDAAEDALNLGPGGAGFGTSTSSANSDVRDRAQAIVDEWDWATDMVFGHLGEITRGSLAPGSVFSLWDEVDPFIEAACDTYPDGWLINLTTNLEHEYAEGGDANQRNILEVTRQHGQLVAIQTAGIGRQPWDPADGSASQEQVLFYAAKGYVRAVEHMLSGISCTIDANGAGFSDDTVDTTFDDGTQPYGPIAFVEYVPALISEGAQTIDAFGDWPNTGSYTFKQYMLTDADSVDSRTAPFTAWEGPAPAPAYRTDVATFTTTAGAKTVNLTTVAGDLLIAACHHTNTAAAHNVTDNQGGTWVEIADINGATGTSGLSMWVRTTLVGTGASTDVTTTVASGTTTGGGICVIAVSGMNQAGLSAIRSIGTQPFTTAATPAPVLDNTPLTTNVIIGAMANGANPAAMTERTGFTERQDLGHASPTVGFHVMTRDGGETTATQTWGSASGTSFAAMVIELNGSIDVSFSTVVGVGTAAGGSTSFTGTAVFDTAVGEAVASGGSTTFTAATDATFDSVVGEATAEGGSTSFTGAAVFATVVGGATGEGGSTSFTGGAVFDSVVGVATAEGGVTTFDVEGDGSFTTVAGEATAEGGSTSFTGAAVFDTVAADATAAGGSTSFTGDAEFASIVGELLAEGGVTEFTGTTTESDEQPGGPFHDPRMWQPLQQQQQADASFTTQPGQLTASGGVTTFTGTTAYPLTVDGHNDLVLELV